MAELAGASKVVFSSTLQAPLSWANTRLISGDPVEAVAAMKEDGSRLVIRTDLRPHGPLRLLAPLLRRYMHSAWNRNLAVIKAQLDNRDQEEGSP